MRLISILQYTEKYGIKLYVIGLFQIEYVEKILSKLKNLYTFYRTEAHSELRLG